MTDVTPPPPDQEPPRPPTGGAPPPMPPPPSGPPPAAPPVNEPPSAPPYGAPTYGTPPPAPPYGVGPQGYGGGFVVGPTDALGRPLAEWWQRLVAIFIDILLLSVPFAILARVVAHRSLGSGHLTASLIAVGVAETVVTLCYFGFLNGSPKGQTLGQMLLGIAVRDAATGGPIEPTRAAWRILLLYPAILLNWVGPLVSLLAGIYTIACGLSPLWHPRRQGWHDKVAKTDVIKVR